MPGPIVEIGVGFSLMLIVTEADLTRCITIFMANILWATRASRISVWCNRKWNGRILGRFMTTI